MRIAILYDCMFPYTVGGAERWYTQLAQRLAEEGHEVTYVTLRQWPKDAEPALPYKVKTVGPHLGLYKESGERRIWPPLRYGVGVFLHMLRRGGRYDLVHSASFPYFSVIASWLALLPRRRVKLAVDWVEVWSREYWIGYLGAVGGRIGHTIQSFCMRLPDWNFTFSRLHASRLPAGGEAVTILTGLVGDYVDRTHGAAARPASDPPVVVFAARHIPEKNVVALPAAMASARQDVPDLRAEIFGDGPQRKELLKEIDACGVSEFIEAPGFVESERIQSAFATAACMVLPSVREGYGLVVIEAASRGTPVVLVDGPDNAAVELVEDGVNGFVASSAEPETLGDAIVRAIRGGQELRESSWTWYERNREKLSIETSLRTVLDAYARLTA
ncbi:MAG: glycosyltransferase [Actinobacteria bacterium]|nr:glycosyltransferase [Actinomycetota bacterium]